MKSDCSFCITECNSRKLKAIINYAMMLDSIVDSDERLNADGVINTLIDDITDREIKALVKRHGFDDESEFINIIGSCSSGEDVVEAIRIAEQKFYKARHQKILSQIPIDDGQRDLPFSFVDET